MSDRSPTQQSAGGEAMFTVIAVAVIVVVATEGLFIAYGNWLFVPLMVLGVLAATAGVIYAVMRTIENDTPVSAAPSAKPQPEATQAVEPTRRPIGGRALAGH